MQIRTIKKNEMDKVENLWDYCFEKKDSAFFDFYFKKYCQNENVIGAFFNNKLAAMVHLNPYNISLYDRSFSTSYLVGVATAPDFRGKGLMKNILMAALSAAKLKDQSFVLLMPSAPGVYLPYGFSYCYNKLSYNMPVKEVLSHFKNQREYDIEFNTSNSYLIFDKIYNHAMIELDGFVKRTENEWKVLLDSNEAEGGYAVTLKNDEEYLAYMIYVVKDGAFNVIELLGKTQKAKEALLNFTGQHFSQCESVLWQMPQNDLTYLKIRETNYFPTLKPFMMARLIDPIKAFEDAKIAYENIDIIIKITDSLLQENNTNFLLKSKNKLAVLEKTDIEYDITMDISSLTQLFFGILDTKNLKQADFLICKKEVENFSFKNKINYINEYF